eukprot:Ihof_evm6s216 gene=Ihof_evmTU6s216
MRSQDLRLLVDRIGDRKQTKRTNALKDLSEWLPTNEFRALLDSHTLGTPTACQALDSTIPPHDNWAILVAGSKGWRNYRHQADIAHANYLLKQNGFSSEHIILMVYDDIPYSYLNPMGFPCIINSPFGENLYPYENVDYRGVDIYPELFEKVLLGQPTHTGSGKTLRSGPNDHVFINFSGHGSVGMLSFPDHSVLTSVELTRILVTMNMKKKFSKLVFYLNSCSSGSMFEHLLPPNINVYANTASDPFKDSYATYWSQLWNAYLGCQYSVSWMESADAYFAKHPEAPYTLQEFFQIVRRQVRIKSQVCEYGDVSLSRKSIIDEFFAYKVTSTSNSRRSASARAEFNVMQEEEPPLACHDTNLNILKKMMETNSTVSLELEEELQARKQAEERFETLASLVAGNE